MRRVGSLVLLGALVLTAVPGFTTATRGQHEDRDDDRESIPPVPCLDLRGCPDLVVDSVQLLRGTPRSQNFTADDCAVLEGVTSPGERDLLRFTFNTPNIGDGALIVGDPLAHPEWFEFDLCHGHYHFIDYADYRLWTVNGFLAWDEIRNEHPEWTADRALGHHRELRKEFVAGHKQGFCMVDVFPALPNRYGVAVPPDPETYQECENQGISRGWADAYGENLDGQWIDVTGVPAGAYVLEAETNPGRLIQETNYVNGRGYVPVTIAVMISGGSGVPTLEIHH